ncbi:MAG: GNAT family N-acetyltransferase [Nitrospinota bacterium]|nr:GNAT family N-acetyltransferase [Nitrospinota bacterium]
MTGKKTGDTMEPGGIFAREGAVRIIVHSSKVRFRKGEYRDVPAMYSLDNRLFMPYAAYDLETFQEFIFNPSIFIIAAQAGDDLAGFLVLSTGRERTMTVITIDVEPSYQDHGIGTRLMALGERMARMKKMAAMLLQVAAGNGPAIRFYERLGYYRTRFMKGYYGGVEDGWEMKKDIATAKLASKGDSSVSTERRKPGNGRG